MSHCAYSEEHEGFKVRLYLEEADYSPRDGFGDDDDVLSKIADGTYLWFTAHVTASKNGVELGHDYLGGCCYESADSFRACGYWNDMRDTAIAEARQVIARLQET